MRRRVWWLILSLVAGMSVLGLAACEAEVEPNNTASQATYLGRLPEGGCCWGSLTLGDVDTYWIYVESEADVRLETETVGDTQLSVYGEVGQWITSDDDSGTGTASKIEMRLPIGRYAVVVSSAGAAIPSYTIRLSGEIEASALSCEREREPNNRFGFADALFDGADSFCRGGSIDPMTDADFYWFRLETAAEVRVETVTTGDTIVWLYDANGAILASDDDSGPGQASLIEQSLAAGRYYAVVASSGNRSIVASYAIRLRVDEISETTDSGATQGLGEPVWGWSITGDGILLSAWGVFDEPCRGHSGTAACPVVSFDVVMPAQAHVALALLCEAGQRMEARLIDDRGQPLVVRDGDAASIYSSWVALPPGPVRVEVQPDRVDARSIFEVHVLVSTTLPDGESAVTRYGPSDRTLVPLDSEGP